MSRFTDRVAARVGSALDALAGVLLPPPHISAAALAEALAADEAEFEVWEASAPDVEAESKVPSGAGSTSWTDACGPYEYLEQFGPRQVWGPADLVAAQLPDGSIRTDFAGEVPEDPVRRCAHLLEDIRNLLSSLVDAVSDYAPPGQPHHAQGSAGVGGSAPPPVPGGADPFTQAAQDRAEADQRVIRRLKDFRDKRGK